MPPTAFTIVEQTVPCTPRHGELAYTAAQPWLIRKVAESDRVYEEFQEAAFCFEVFEGKSENAWDSLFESELIEPTCLATLEQALSYAPGLVCFYPVALFAEDLPPAKPWNSFSEQEALRHNERWFKALTTGVPQISPAARRVLGNGYTSVYTSDNGVPAYALMEVQLSEGAVLLGWGLMWQPYAK